jgi:hypothetical protein
MPAQQKAGPVSAYANRGPACICVAEPHQAAAILAPLSQSRSRLDVSQRKYCTSAKAYFFFFLAVFFFAFAFLAFLAMVPSVVPN